MSNFTKLKLCHTFGISQSTHIWVKGALTALLLVLCGNVAKAQSDLTFKEGIRYSKWVIDSRMNDFYANTTKCGFAVYDQNGNQTADLVDKKGKLDYVVGLVAKSIIEASQYYSQFEWAESFAKPWFLSIKNYGDNFYSKFSTSGGSLDDLNAVKLFIPLRAMTATDGKYPTTTTYGYTTSALNNAIKGLKAHNDTYSIGTGTLAETAGNTVAGGWWHKSIYENQMWLDGAYMGPALFAELVNYSGKKTNIDSTDDWDLIVKQFTILHEMCWNSDDKLPYHAFAADGGTNSTSHSNTWYGLSSKSPYVFHSASYWGRAVGWYFLALVDILEQMDKANLSSSTGYTTLKGYLAETAEGLKVRQDKATGGWYQILDEDGTYSASEYNNGLSHTTTYNYIESSATALFTAAYLKAIRKGYLDETTYKTVAVNGYKCLVNQFFSVDENGNVNIFGSCRSAGLGGNEDKNAAGEEKFRDGSKPYYLLGYDVAMVKKSENITEGKVLGAFILAATEYERLYQSPMLLSKDLNKKYSLGPNESLSAEVLGEGTATYQWYDATTSTAITGATNASYTPTKSGKYYCVITVTPPSTAAKTRAASTEPYTITTSTADVTVAAAGGETGGSVTSEVIYFKTKDSNISTNTSVVDASGTQTTTGSVTYDGTTYTNGVKLNSSGIVKLNLTSSSTVTLVFRSSDKGRTVYIGSNSYTIKDDGTLTVELEAGQYEIKRNSKESRLFAVDIQPTGSSISISTQPKSADYVTGATTVTPLTVVATLDGYTLSYQWYENTTNSNTGGTVISGATTDRYTPTLSSTAGTTYYYCAVTATKDGSETLTATSDVAAITVSEPYVKFTTQPTSGSYAINVAASALTVVAATNLGVEPTYQWYSNSSATTEGATQITDATSASYTPSTSTVGTTYYYCIATAQKDGTTVTATSNIVSVTVATAIYSYKVNGTNIAAPGINTSKYITTNSDGETGDKLVKMTFGGWKWDGFASEEAKQEGTKTKGSYIIVRGESTKYYTDSWKKSTGGANIASIDNYQYWFEGTQDAVDESKALTGTIYGTPRYGWFVSPTRDADGKTTVSHPYTLPVRGSFMTFEPTMNGTLSIYILQNGAWNTNKSGTYTDPDGGGTIEYSTGDIVPGEFRPHAFHVVNQRGLTVQEFSPKYSVETKQKVNSQYYCMFEGEGDQTEYNSPYNVAKWTEFKDYMSKDEQQRCHDNWNNGEGGAQTIIELDNGSFLAIEKGIVKYTFHVTGNETYYFFSNFSKMGFAGASFLPDESQPTATPAEGQISTLELSDVTAYNKITATEKGTIEGTTLKDYTYKIGETEIAPVAGVSIPQFYSITLTRTFKPNQWTTLTLPFNLTEEEVQKIFGDGTRLVMLHDATLQNEGAHLTFIYHEIQNVLPGYPYLIKPTLKDITNDAHVSVTKADNNTALTSFTVYGKCINPFIKQFEVKTTPYTFKGTPGYCTADKTNNGKTGYSVNYAENDIFVSEGNGNLYVSGGTSYGKGYRSWIEKKTVAEGGTSQTAKSISVVMSSFSDDDDTTTSIDVAEMAPDLIEALGIQTGVYNLSGQRVANDTRNLKAGIYIVNGKKTVVR